MTSPTSPTPSAEKPPVEKSLALYKHDSGNGKLGDGVDATYVSIDASCPTGCALRDAGCYAQLSFVGLITGRLDKASAKSTTTDLSTTAALDEAQAIDAAYRSGPVPKGQLLRLHVAGDCRTDFATRIVAQAAARWLARGGAAVWTYTHAWRDVARASWGPVHVFASIEDPRDADLAVRRGYVPAIVVPHHAPGPDGARAKTLVDSDVVFVPCPAQTRDLTCAECKLCTRSGALHQGRRGISFAAHGATVKTARHLPLLDQVRLPF